MEDKDYIKLGVTPPSKEQHGYDRDISQNMRKLMPNTWTLEGNKLMGQTEMGIVTQFIPTDYILVGTENGLPRFRKVV